MDEVRYCDACGQRIRKLNPHRMDKQKVALLELLAKARLAGEEWVKVLHGSVVRIDGENTAAPYRAEAHASRLSWFGLAEHGDPRSGLYRITDHGFLFLQGRYLVPALIYCKDGVVLEQSEARVSIHQVKDVVFDKAYWDSYPGLQRHQRSANDGDWEQPGLWGG